MKWSLLVVLLVMVVLGLPNGVTASPPSVQPPTGQQSGGVFYGPGPYTFATYINCDAGPSFNGSYSNALEGTHTFTFVGAADGSLLVRIDGGGAQLITSCGDPTPTSTVASYTVTYSYAGPPPTPAPTPPPTPAPTPPPVNGGGGGSTGGGPSGSGQTTPVNRNPGGTAQKGTSIPPGPTPVTVAPTVPGVNPVITNTTPSPSPAVKPSPKPVAQAAAPSGRQSSTNWMLIWGLLLLLLLAIALAAWYAYHSPPIRAWWQSTLLGWRVRLGPWWFRLRLAAKRLGQIHGHQLPKRRGLSEPHHTGKILAHHHTSYPALAFLIMLSAVLLGTYSMNTRAESSLLSLTVLGAPPAVGATIDQPVTGDNFTVATTTVRGTCPLGLMVEIYRNNVFAGSVMCDAAGLYSLVITLVPGQNELVARVVDGLGQYGPDSNIVIVDYDEPPTPTPTPSPTPVIGPSPGPGPGPTATPRTTVKPGPKPSIKPRPGGGTPGPGGPAGPAPFLITTRQHAATGIEVGDAIQWVVTLSGGTKPYRLTWDWGDGTKDKFDKLSPGDLVGGHRYTVPGSYRLILRGYDAAGRETILNLVAQVSGPVGIPSTVDRSALFVAWPVLCVTGLLVLSFWLGEHHKLSMWRFGHAAPT